MGKTAKTSSSHTVTPENFNRSGFSSAYGNDLTKTALKRLRRKSRKSVEQARYHSFHDWASCRNTNNNASMNSTIGCTVLL